MGPLSTLRNIFTLDTLDPRLTAQRRSSSPPKNRNVPSLSTQNGESSSAQTRRTKEETSPSMWNTPEFYIYYVIFAIAVPMMFKVAHDVSKESHPNYEKYSHLLSSGWIPGRRVDNSDAQYASFRNHIPILFGVLALHFVLRRGFNFVFTLISPTPPANSSHRAAHNLTRRKIFDIIFALIFLFALHSLSLIKIFVIILINFLISYFHPSSIWNPILTWVFNIGILFANEYFQGYRFSKILPFLIAGEGQGVGYAMDHFMNGGLLRRWEILFNITVLRLISYNIDHYWAACRLEEGDDEPGSVLEVGSLANTGEDGVVNAAGSSRERLGSQTSSPGRAERGLIGSRESEDGPSEAERLMMNYRDEKKKHADPVHMSERDRIDTPAPIQDYSLLNYISYVLYSPLYLAGPIITFNDFLHQQKHSTPTLSVRRTILYAIRLLASLFTMELILHYIYVVAISKSLSRITLSYYTPAQLAMIGYFNLHIIWLKLMIPWRFFRLWSLTDSIDPVENMLRCMSNNPSALAFWRAWHRSFNRWTVRYIYIPIGGAKRPIVNMLAVFTFVALWHDISLRLLTWGWLIVLFVAPEMIAKKVVTLRRLGGNKVLFRHMAAVGAVGNVLMMMAANLVGFAIGLDGLKELVAGVVGSFNGVVFFAMACCALFVGVQIMYEIREDEKRRGINLRC